MIPDESNSFVLNSRQEPQLAAKFEHEAVPSFLSVIIPVYKDAPGLTDTLSSLKKQTLPSSLFEIIVVNDGGDPAISSVCAAFPVTEIVQTPNQGSYAARNAGLRKSRGGYIGFVDADVVVDPEWCAHGIEALSRAHIVAGCTGVMLSPSPSLVEIWQEAHYFNAEGWSRQRIAMTVNLFLRRKVLEEMGWFDARFRSGGDVEFTHRAGQNSSYDFVYDARVKCLHPPRSYEQVSQALSRIVYGQIAANETGKQTGVPLPSFFRLILPPQRCSTNDISHLRLDGMDRLRLYFFTWYIKLKMAGIRISIWMRRG